MRYGNIALNREEVEHLQQDIKRRGIDPKTEEGQELLKELVHEYKDGIWANRDYVYGQDEG